jgi:uncharacterized protein
MTHETARPWYRQPWPWLLAIPPTAAVIGGAITLYLAISRPDILISKDCHRDGAITVCGEAAPRSP